MGLAMLAAGIRWLAAAHAYPACGDASHFVQHGVALASGIPKAMSAYWSQGMIAIAAAAARAGGDPRCALQAATLLAGVGVVLLFAGVILRLSGSRRLALAGGLILAANPTLVHYSITGYSEIPYMFFLLSGVYCGLGSRQPPAWRYVLAGVIIGMGGYFKGLDAAVAAAGFGLYAFITSDCAWGCRLRRAGLPVIAAFLVMLPLCLYTHQEIGRFTPGAKGGQLIVGLDWKDSKKGYAAESTQFSASATSEPAPGISDLIREMPGRIRANAISTMHVFSDQIFQRGLRLGTLWFVVGLAGAVLVLWKNRVQAALLPACMLVLQIGALWLVFVLDRVLLPSLPWVVLSLLLAGREVLARYPIRGFAPALLLAAFTMVNVKYAVHAFTREFFWWRYPNLISCAAELRRLGGTDADTIMSFGPTLAVEFNRTNPLKTVEVPYGSIEQVGQVADQFDVRFIVLSDAFRPHWPISGLYADGAMPPRNWILRKELVFPEAEWDGRWGHPGERCRIYERTKQAGTQVPMPSKSTVDR